MKTSCLRLITLFGFTCCALSLRSEEFLCTTNQGAITITQYNGSGGEVVVPAALYGYPVAAIGDNAFNWVFTVTSVTLPDTVTSIGEQAFYNCFNLTNFNLGKSIARIGSWAFSSCTNVARIDLPPTVKTIGRSAFQSCLNLAAIDIPDGVTVLGPFTFADCDALGTVRIPGSVTNIGASAFAGCSSLTNAIVGRGVAALGESAFYNCEHMTALYFEGNAPAAFDETVLSEDYALTVYYLPGTIGWGATFSLRPTALWTLPNPVILTTPPDFGFKAGAFGFTLSWATNDRPVMIEACTNLANPDWVPAGIRTLTSGSASYSDLDFTNFHARYYRLRTP